MNEPPVPSPVYAFEGFRLHGGARRLLRDGAAVPLSAKLFDTLLLLVKHSGTVLTKAEMMKALWPETVVEENNLNQSISALRRVLGDGRGSNRFIATISGKGYCFTAKVQLLEADEAEANGAQVSLAVLPFVNLGAGPERDYLADGLTEETIATLGQIEPERFSVVGRTTVMTYRGTAKPLAEIGRELNAAYLIEGSLRAEGDRVRVTATLVRAADQRQIWSATYDSQPASMLALQRELAGAIAQQVRLRLSPARLQAVAHRRPNSAEAYDLYLRGRFFFNQFTPPSTRKAVEYFTQATELDPGYALAWSGLTDALCSSPVSGDLPVETVKTRTRHAAQQAVAAAPQLAESQTSHGFFCFWMEWDWQEAELAFRRGIALDSSYAFAHRMLGVLLSHLCRPEEAAAWIRRAREVDPLNAMNRALSSQVAFAGRRFEEAEAFAREAIAIDPEFWIGHFQLGQALASREDERSFDALAQAFRLSGNSKAISVRGYLLAKLGRHAEAREVLRTMDGIAQTRFMPPYAHALVRAALGDVDAAFAALDESMKLRDIHLAFLTIDPKWDELRDDMRFKRILDSCGFGVESGQALTQTV